MTSDRPMEGGPLGDTGWATPEWRLIGQEDVAPLLALHKVWLETGRKEGRRLNLIAFRIEDVSFEGQDLREAIFKDCLFFGCRMDGALLDDATFQTSNLASIPDLTQEQINVAGGDGVTQLPDGINRPSDWGPITTDSTQISAEQWMEEDETSEVESASKSQESGTTGPSAIVTAKGVRAPKGDTTLGAESGSYEIGMGEAAASVRAPADSQTWTGHPRRSRNECLKASEDLSAKVDDILSQRSKLQDIGPGHNQPPVDFTDDDLEFMKILADTNSRMLRLRYFTDPVVSMCRQVLAALKSLYEEYRQDKYEAAGRHLLILTVLGTLIGTLGKFLELFG